MIKTIRIGRVEVPLVDYAVGASAVLGIRDSGKTVTSKGIAEQLLDHNIPIIVFDAVGKWRWMKSASEQPDGKAYKVVVAGGRVPDLPLTPHSVPEIVRSALKERIPLIIDLFSKDLSKADWRRIVQTAIHIIHYENEGGAVHVFLEEAAEFVPQKVYDGETYAEVEKLVRMGGNASVGITLINQRSQEVNKAVLDNCSTALVLGCQVGKNAIEAVEKWIERLDPRTAGELTQSLPKLKAGEAWVWTRKSLDKPTKEQMPMCRSFHPDRRTPEFVLKSIKSLDTDEFVERLTNSIPKVIEEAKANDPAELRKKLAEANRLNSVLQNSKKATETKEVQVPMLSKDERKRLTKLAQAFDKLYSAAEGGYETMLEVGKATNDLKPEIQFFKNLLTPKKDFIGGHQITREQAIKWLGDPKTWGKDRHRVRKEFTAKPDVFTNGDLTGPERKLLGALALYPNGMTKTKLAILTGYAHSGGAFNNPLGALRSRGMAEGSSDCIRITDLGVKSVGHVEPLPVGKDLINYWSEKLPGPEREIFRVVVESEDPLSKEEVAQRCRNSRGEPYEVTGGAFNNPLGKLRTLGIIKRGPYLQLSDEFFE